MKNLLYTIVAGEDRYFAMLDYFLSSLTSSNCLDRLDVWIFTDDANIQRLKKIYNNKFTIIGCNAHPYVFPKFNNVKFEIFEQLPENKYDKVLYCDIDVLINGNLDKVFDTITQDKVYAMPEGPVFFNSFVNDRFHFYSIYSKDKQKHLIENKAAFYCAGVFGFKATSTKIKDIFKLCRLTFDNTPSLKNLLPSKTNSNKIIDQAVFNTELSYEPMLNGQEILLQAFDICEVKDPPFNAHYSHTIMHFIHPHKDKRLPAKKLPTDKLDAMRFVWNKLKNV
jgi:hypothetical protein